MLFSLPSSDDFSHFLGVNQKCRIQKHICFFLGHDSHLKNGIGKLSAYCGVISAGCGAACGICYQDGGDLEAVSHTLVNALAVNSGVVCDGAKPSCAAKIASAIEAGLLGYEMYRHGSQFRGGEGIVSKGVENTIRNISRLAREGMQQTDREIIEIMTGCC